MSLYQFYSEFISTVSNFSEIVDENEKKNSKTNVVSHFRT